jgi:cytochrome c biogenesis factor
MWHTYGIIGRYTPSVVPAMRAARQQHDGVHFSVINAIHVPVALAALALLPVLLLLGLKRADFADLGRLAATVMLALLANAAFCGVISNPHDRYGSRMVWIAVFAIALAGRRFYEVANVGRSIRRESASTV